ncbi:MAG: sporulation inhibitor of replication protein SirA [Bacilli bacterium]|nr:sporulation inhibitor of replication protein SirA [Bacilli bacterium]
MKVYYIFKIKKEFVNLYKDTPSVLYNILKSIYYLDKEEVDYGYNLFKQLICPLEKDKLDRNLFIKFHQDIPYSKRKNIHYINNLYRNEISRLVINNCYIRLEMEQNFSTFFEVLKNDNNNFFACSFKTTDFFFLEDYPR